MKNKAKKEEGDLVVRGFKCSEHGYIKPEPVCPKCRTPHQSPEGWQLEVKQQVGLTILAAYAMVKDINEFGSRNPTFDDAMKYAGDEIDKLISLIKSLLTSQAQEQIRRVLKIIELIPSPDGEEGKAYRQAIINLLSNLKQE